MYLAWVFFVHNCFRRAPGRFYGRAGRGPLERFRTRPVNGFMWGSKLLGIAVGGAGMATVVAYTISAAGLIQAA